MGWWDGLPPARSHGELRQQREPPLVAPASAQRPGVPPREERWPAREAGEPRPGLLVLPD
jgi:hypothetical protein